MISRLWLPGILIGAAITPGFAQEFDSFGRSEVLPEPERDWVFVDYSLVDVADDRFLGLIGVAETFPSAAIEYSADGSSLFVVETFYTRGNRGDRTDTVTIFDTSTLGVSGEIVIPAKRALMLAVTGTLALTDNDRFLAVFNLTPATSISVVDVETRSFVGEISTPGCSLVFATGDLSYAMICANGDLLSVSLDENGREVSKERTEQFFDPEVDPIREPGVRYADEWLFASFDGILHSVDVSGSTPRIGESWSLLTASDRDQNWRITGRQPLAVHQQSGRLYVLARQNDEPLDDPADWDGTEIWSFDLATRERVQRLEALPESDESEGAGAAIGATSGDGASNIQVTQGDEPLLVSAAGSGISVRHAMTGEYLHERLQNAPSSGWLSLRIR